MPLYSEINKQDSQLRIHAYKSKLFFTSLLAENQERDLDNLAEQLMLGSSLELGTAVHVLP